MGALTQAIREFHGGIIVISHNAEFTKSVCTEQWVVKDGQVFVEGEVQEKAVKATSSRKLKAENKALEAPKNEKSSKVGNINGNIASQERIKNPRTFEYLTPVEVRKLTKLSTAAGLSLKDYIGKMTPSSPEWKWL
jgi:ABC-type methionine transport system ATPase subunit